IRQMGLDQPIKAEMYLPYEQVTEEVWFAPRDLALRVSRDPMTVVSSVREAVRAVDPNQPVSNIATMEQLLSEGTAHLRFGMSLLVTFAAVALLLAVVVIYGVLAYFVLQHTNEHCERLAHGATPGNIVLLVIKKGMGLTLVGVGAGIA